MAPATSLTLPEGSPRIPKRRRTKSENAIPARIFNMLGEKETHIEGSPYLPLPDNGTTVTVVVGTDEDMTELSVSESLICQHSPVFERACKDDFTEGTAKRIVLENVESLPFRMLATWLTGDMVNVPRNEGPVLILLAKLWRLADRFMIPALLNATMTTLHGCIFSSDYCPIIPFEPEGLEFYNFAYEVEELGTLHYLALAHFIAHPTKAKHKKTRLTVLKKLTKFSKEFRLLCPVPKDVVEMLANDPEKQREIIVKRQEEADEAWEDVINGEKLNIGLDKIEVTVTEKVDESEYRTLLQRVPEQMVFDVAVLLRKHQAGLPNDYQCLMPGLNELRVAED